MGKTRKESVKFKETEQQAMIQNKLLTVRFGKTLLLGLVMNFPWLLSFVKVFSKNTSDYIWYPFVIFHGFQVFFSTYLHTLLCTVMCKRNHQTYILKGQLISKGNFCVFNSDSPKNQLENVNFCPSLLGQKFSVRFLGELKKLKIPFEINWPLRVDEIPLVSKKRNIFIFQQFIYGKIVHCAPVVFWL